jgi:hypothetical protein
MADVSRKLEAVMEMVDYGDYFAISRPRQYGKTTLLYLISDALGRSSQDYIVLNISFEGIGDLIFENETSFSQEFAKILSKYSKVYAPNLEAWLAEEAPKMQNIASVSRLISDLVDKSGKKIVLLIDEVDKSSNNQLFVSFLAMLRNKFLERDVFPTFHSVILAGLHDVKSLKLKLRPDEEAKYNSPWNIAVDFKVVMELQPIEIVPMLQDYAQEQAVQMDFQAVADALFYFTSGYPFLVSALCKIAAEDILPTKHERTWTAFDIEIAADRLIKADRSNTNFDTLIKNLENNPDLYQLVFRQVVESEPFSYNVHDPIINFGLLHGIFRNGQGLNMHNRIYREVIVNYMTSKAVTRNQPLNISATEPYLLANNALDMQKVLLKFQALMQEEHSTKDSDFLERNGRLVFLAFLKPIINGKGYAFKEPEISEERRMDIAVNFFQHKYVVEMKMWYGDTAHKRGLAQLRDYLERQNLTTGYLVIFEKTGAKSWKKGWIRSGGKKIFAIWV